MKAIKSVLISLLVVSACSAMALAMPYGRVIIVNASGSGDYPTIQAAIYDSDDGDTIILQPGTYTGNGNRDIDFLGKAITVRSIDPNDCNVVAATIINCQGSSSSPHRGFYFHSLETSSSVLAGLTITNGYTSSGGGIRCKQSGPTITKCIIIANSASYGEGGGMYNYGLGNPTVTNCRFISNSARWGGGMYNDWLTTPTVTNCRFISNWAIYSGGGMMNELSSATMENCIFWGNSAGTGGAISFEGALILTIINCTFSINTAADYGGAIYCLESGNTVMVNCILWGDTAPNGPEIAMSGLQFNPELSIDFSDVQGGIMAGYWRFGELDWGLHNVDADPCFADPNNGDFHLKSQAGRWDANEGRWTKDEVTSLCIDAGDPSSPIGFEPFPNGGIINMGAYGGTAEASKSYFGQPVCETIVAGDINGDCKVNFTDFALMALHWLEDRRPYNPNPNCIVKEGIEYCMQTDKVTYNLGEDVLMLYRVTNLRDENVAFVFLDQYQYFFEVTDNGAVIWFEPRVEEPGVSWFVLEPNGYKEYAEVWNMMNYNGTYGPDDDYLVTPGIYVVTGSFNPIALGPADKYVPVSVQIEIIP